MTSGCPLEKKSLSDITMLRQKTLKNTLLYYVKISINLFGYLLIFYLFLGSKKGKHQVKASKGKQGTIEVYKKKVF